ncbi:hypothetical protein HPB50_018349 [Hyalomma asiaticum]|uniref:Uncharacterized protein n=1 Tax=Hyalomma asiaticum TaxID=266040 RepID=A0ACB7RJX6_HYAAI|nr:hypothetical protein HPB50_018349 [Hyalomma asiaticum]
MTDRHIDVEELGQREARGEAPAPDNAKTSGPSEDVVSADAPTELPSTSWLIRANAPEYAKPTATSSPSGNKDQTAWRKRGTVGSEPGPSVGKKLKLSDHIPESFVMDYESRDTCTLKLTNFGHGVTEADVIQLCANALEVKHKFKDGELLCSFALYESEEGAMEAVRCLKDAQLKGSPFLIIYCGAKWKHLTQRPEVLQDTLDLQNVPESLQDRDKLAALFPTGQVVGLWPNGFAQARVKFPSSEALIEAVKKPECRTVDGHHMKLALAVAHREHAAWGALGSASDKQPQDEAAKVECQPQDGSKEENSGNNSICSGRKGPSKKSRSSKGSIGKPEEKRTQ